MSTGDAGNDFDSGDLGCLNRISAWRWSLCPQAQLGEVGLTGIPPSRL